MGINPIPKMRTGVSPKDMSWNELFYLFLQKPFWIIAGLIVFGILTLVFSFMGKVGDILDVAVLLLWGVGIVYIPVALPASIIYATVQRFRFGKMAKE